MFKRTASHIQFMALSCLLLSSPAWAQWISVLPDKPAGIYDVGQHVHWTVMAKDVSDTVSYTVAPNQGVVTANGSLDLSKGPATFETTFDVPSTVLIKVTGHTADGKEIVGTGGAVAGVDQIVPSAPRPKDFDAFWDAKIKELSAVPVDAKLTPADAGRAGVTYEKITMNNIRGTHIEGQIARPEKGDKFPAVLIVQWAGVYALQKSWVTDRAANGWLALDISAHDLPIDEPASFYKQQFDGPLKNYWAIGNDNRETSYFLRMYLSCYRAAEYLKSRSDWDGKTIIVMGGSQGGMQTLMIAGLDPIFTAAMAEVPAGCDMLGPAIGRRGGWPQWYDWTKGIDFHQPDNAAKVHEASRYFDVINFASRIKCPVLIGAGLIDETVPAAGVIAEFNEIKSPKELVLLPTGAHQDENHSHAAYSKRLWNSWLPTLVKGQPAPVQ